MFAHGLKRLFLLIVLLVPALNRARTIHHRALGSAPERVAAEISGARRGQRRSARPQHATRRGPWLHKSSGRRVLCQAASYLNTKQHGDLA
jgi:hypothetical protein